MFFGVSYSKELWYNKNKFLNNFARNAHYFFLSVINGCHIVSIKIRSSDYFYLTLIKSTVKIKMTFLNSPMKVEVLIKIYYFVNFILFVRFYYIGICFLILTLYYNKIKKIKHSVLKVPFSLQINELKKEYWKH